MERKEHWSKSEVHELLKMKVNPDTLIKAEERGDIPEAERFKRKGKRGIEVRKWRRDQLPAIGAKYGFLKQPKEQHVICVFTPKGGVLKTTLSFNFARLLALNGIKTLVIGLDAQCSMTDLLLTANTVENLDDIAQDIHTLQQHTEEVEHHIRRRVWLGQLFDTVFVAGVFCLYPLSLLIFMPLANKLLLFTPSVLILFSILFFSLMTAYLWLFHYFQIPTLGMQFQYMTVWPEQWRWSRTKIFPAFGRAFGHLTLDSLRRDVSCDP
jgi:hypothetical protein